MFSWASRQEELFGSGLQPPKSGCTSIRFPPTAFFSFCQLSSFGQSESEGRTRRIRASVAAAARKGHFHRKLNCTTPAMIPFRKVLLRIFFIVTAYKHDLTRLKISDRAS